MIALVAIAFTVLYREVLTNLIASIIEHIQMHEPFTSSNSITDNLEYLKSRDLVIIGAFILAATTVWSYLIAQLALRPTRTALESQKQFIGNIAHELRTPLSIIKTNTEVRLFDNNVPPVARQIHESNLDELNRISNIINNLLSLSSLTRREQMPFGNVDLGLVVASVVAQLQHLAAKKRIEIMVNEGEFRTVWGNASALEQIVMNVVKNAINYTKEGGDPVRIDIQPDLQGAIEIIVEDSGIGIPEKDLYHIFEPFYRGDASRARGEAGSGLGLTIVNELLKIHHGKMLIRSAPRYGTKVTISLPPGKPEVEEDRHLYEQVAIDFSNA